ncbi:MULTISPECIES: DUF6059 family protein [unclassified Streptomyces]|uniref:DUF6059 family protein n=1 Tax=unclassified Streptomyces TaxID=2593676 RepID=UPI000F4EAAAF|nr:MULTISPECIES: DUF6059 family protein [unclassified Streptomyces]MDH6453717.1 hypothetical protein [Streptomyces sp. SAI-119]MDH6495725.1 hypothetical protein [Streptomyces sp. SAI-149]QUC57380.1 hypothetical protein IOD14_11545 [Streptomyces sp. A2-16]GLP63757.1 hypothetical protein TUSST3_03780 [Streptomyces sp. TUS-ST3]
MQHRTWLRRWSVRALRTVGECFAALAPMYGVLPPFDLTRFPPLPWGVPSGPPPIPRELSAPPPCHPERLCPDLPLTDAEQALLRELSDQRWPTE